MKIFSIFDKKISANSFVFTAVHSAQAIRSLHQALTDPKSEIAKYPTDFALYELGEIDMSTGRITPCDHPKLLIDAHELAASIEK